MEKAAYRTAHLSGHWRTESCVWPDELFPAVCLLGAGGSEWMPPQFLWWIQQEYEVEARQKGIADDTSLLPTCDIYCLFLAFASVIQKHLSQKQWYLVWASILLFLWTSGLSSPICHGNSTRQHIPSPAVHTGEPQGLTTASSNPHTNSTMYLSQRPAVPLHEGHPPSV